MKAFNAKTPSSGPGDQLKLQDPNHMVPKKVTKVDPLYRGNVRANPVKHGKKSKKFGMKK